MGHPGRLRKHNPIADDIRRCIRIGDEDGAKRLLAANEIDISDGEAGTPLLWATFHNRPQLLKWIIERGGNVNHQDRIGYSALHFAGQEKATACAEILFATGAKTELRDIYGNTPLWTAAFWAKGDLSVVELLILHGASFENVNAAGRTPQYIAEIKFPDQLPRLMQLAATSAAESSKLKINDK